MEDGEVKPTARVTTGMWADIGTKVPDTPSSNICVIRRMGIAWSKNIGLSTNFQVISHENRWYMNMNRVL